MIAVFVYRDMPLSRAPQVLTEGTKVTAMLMFIIANAYLFAFVLTTEQIPQMASEAILHLGLEPWALLLFVNVLLLLMGNFMEPSSVILILAPVIFPIAVRAGIDPIHLGIIMVINMEIGMVTPPVGLNLFVTAGVANMALEEVVRAALPWLLILLSFLSIVTYIPAISLALPDWLYAGG